MRICDPVREMDVEELRHKITVLTLAFHALLAETGITTEEATNMMAMMCARVEVALEMKEGGGDALPH